MPPYFPLAENTHTYLHFRSALPANTLILEELRGREGISELFEWTLQLYSPDVNLDFDALVNHEVTVELAVGPLRRYVNGIITEFIQGPSGSREKRQVTYYTALVRPMLWRLTLRTNCRIFQDKTTREIIAFILDEHHIQWENRVRNAGGDKREYCVQYDESDFDFISRLMEDVGIFYFFTHTPDSHIMILGDDPAAHKPCPFAETSVMAHKAWKAPPFNTVIEANLSKQIVPQRFKARDYNYTRPKDPLEAQTDGHGSTQVGELYYYPGGYQDVEKGLDVTRTRIQAVESPECLLKGRTTIPFYCPGFTTNLQDHFRLDANQQYVLYQVEHHISLVGELEVEGQLYEPGDLIVDTTFTAFPAELSFRPPRLTPRPKIYGSQTAKVTGKAGEVIWTDDYGRIKVKFHWDRYSPDDEHSSCWIRVGQGWAGHNWGILFTPRIGHEVIISFLEGDPDRPLVTGSVYNHDYMPPYLPSEPTISTIKSNNVPGGMGYNEIRFQDKKDEEQIFIHAQKDYDTHVRDGSRTCLIQAKAERPGNDLLRLTRGDRMVNLEKGNLTTLLNEGNETRTLENGNRITTLMNGDETLTLENGNRVVSLLNGNENHFNSKNFTHEVLENYMLTVEQNMVVVVGGMLDITVSGPILVEGSELINVTAGAAITVEAGEDIAVTAGGAIEVTSGEEMAITSGMAMEITSGLEMALTSGLAMELTSGLEMAVTAGLALQVTAGADVAITGGGMFNIQAPGAGTIFTAGGLLLHGIAIMKL